ncbi:MAG: redoxin domain-containing protein [Myxococcales bacterium]|nr:redoxin domain-containing protein [Myxococcales bacterium]
MKLASLWLLGVLSLGCSGSQGSEANAGSSGSGSGGAGGSVGATGGATSGGATSSGGAGGVAGAAGSLGSGGASNGGKGGADWGPSACPAPTTGVGYSVGDTLGDLTVVDCDTGAPRSLSEVCGAAATWVFVAHSHCPTCKGTAGFTPSVAQKVASQNVAIAHIMYDDNGTSCATWRKGYGLEGLPNVKVYQDPTGAVWSKLKTSNYTAPSVFLNAARVITHQEHGMSESEVLTQITSALSN